MNVIEVTVSSFPNSDCHAFCFLFNFDLHRFRCISLCTSPLPLRSRLAPGAPGRVGSFLSALCQYLAHAGLAGQPQRAGTVGRDHCSNQVSPPTRTTRTATRTSISQLHSTPSWATCAALRRRRSSSSRERRRQPRQQPQPIPLPPLPLPLSRRPLRWLPLPPHPHLPPLQNPHPHPIQICPLPSRPRSPSST